MSLVQVFLPPFSWQPGRHIRDLHNQTARTWNRFLRYLFCPFLFESWERRKFPSLFPLLIRCTDHRKDQHLVLVLLLFLLHLKEINNECGSRWSFNVKCRLSNAQSRLSFSVGGALSRGKGGCGDALSDWLDSWVGFSLIQRWFPSGKYHWLIPNKNRSITTPTYLQKV